MKELLKELSLAFGPSGYEDEVRKIIEDKIKSYQVQGSELYSDNLGNLIYHLPSKDMPKLVINAHMDEVGFMVTEACEDGLLRFGCVGGIDSSVIPSKLVISENGICGNVITKPIHLLTKEEREQNTKISDMLIDIGARDKKEAEALAPIGTYFTFKSDFVEFGEGFIKGKALDDRLGCAVMCQLIKDIYEKGLKVPYDLYFAFSVREEVGYSGAFAVAERIKPKYALVLESKAVCDLYGVPKEKQVCTLGDGFVLSFADRATIYDRGVVEHVSDLCKKGEIKYQVNKFISGGNDSAKFQMHGGGAKVSVFSLASRYIHSMADVIHADDLDSMYKATYAVLTDENPLK